MEHLQHTQRQTLESEDLPEPGVRHAYQWWIVCDVERGVDVRVHPQNAIASWNTYVARHMTGGVRDEDFDLYVENAETLYKSAKFGCYYTVDVPKDHAGGLSYAQAAWWLANGSS
jgi:hypothetical protein